MPSLLHSILHGEPPESWDKLWVSEMTPWDAGRSAPELVRLLDDQNSSDPLYKLPFGQVLVPGCGTGYDLINFAKSGRMVIGLDISEKAVEISKQYMQTHAPELYPSLIHVLQGDFLTLDMDGSFDIIYDYTFFCAIPPGMRAHWGQKMSKLIKTGGVLVTLMFPIDPNIDKEGPPFPVRPESYSEVLLPVGFSLQLLQNVESFGPRQGKEKLGIWRRESS